jgi:hypothetical protein
MKRVASRAPEGGRLYILGFKAPQNCARNPLHDGFFLGLFFDPEDGSDIFLRNVD